MFLAELNSKSNKTVPMTLHSQEEYWQKQHSKYTLEQIGDMPQQINIQKNTNSFQVNQKIKQIQSFNDEQRVAYEIIRDHFSQQQQNPDNNQLLMIITGTGGSGKSCHRCNEKLVKQSLQSLFLLWYCCI